MRGQKALQTIRFLLLFSLLSAVAVAEMFWEWDLFIWYRRAYLVLATVWGLVFPPRDWCRYVCVLGAYAQLFSRVRILGIRLDRDMCLRCGRCACGERCPMHIDGRAGSERPW